ncbi:MAG TPA: HAD family hydrolase [Nocardioidaceae bacterium]|nr:HAD family hydrolase [Nocardioidaceae bacterium]
MTRRCELVIYDCDGVLVDSERISVRIDAIVLAELGWPISEAEVVERFVGRSQASMVAEVEAHLGRPLPVDWDAENGPQYRAAFEAELRPVDGILEALDAISIPGCVASSSDHERLRFTLGLVGLYERFAGRIFSATDVARGKPEPDLFLYAAAQCGVEPAHCVVVEDSRWGVQAARAAGMRAVGYAGGLTDAAALSGADTVVIDEMAQLSQALGTLCTD